MAPSAVADLLQVKGVGDSLAGRAETLELLPLSQGEIARRDTAEDFVSWLLSEPSFPATGEFEALDPGVVLAGGYPEALVRTPRRAQAWFASYASRLSDHDARELQGGGYADHLEALLMILAAGAQQEIVRARLARELGISENTVEAYLRMTAVMRLLVQLPPWGRNLRGRVTRRSKVALNDTGFAAALTGFTDAQAHSLGGREHFGSLVEQFVALELAKQRVWSEQLYRIYHYRDTDGLEIDVVIELADGRLIALEVKAATDVTAKAWRNLERFRERFAEREVVGVCFYAGAQPWVLHGWLYVLPITALWQH